VNFYVEPEGELAYRILKNYARLEEADYRPETIFAADKNHWPGDWAGRTILALALLARATGRRPAFLSEILIELEKRLNSQGYMGDARRPENGANEQQISGHNWLLRGLLEHYVSAPREGLERMIRTLVRNLYLPLEGLYRRYPLDPALRGDHGGPAGSLKTGFVDGWQLSSDIGCAFMPLDALSQYYAVFRDKAVLPLLREMVDSFASIDCVRSNMQTHASLSATRGVMRLYNAIGDARLLDRAVAYFALYLDKGMNESYANYNWYGRVAWTEPCAIVDSYLLATELFKATGEARYLEIGTRILYNALCRSQRENGGFGCDSNVAMDDARQTIAVRSGCYEAYWCCSMRGAEGLCYAAQNAYLPGEGTGVFANYLSGEYRHGGLSFQVRTQYPYGGEVEITLLRCDEPTEWRFFVLQSPAGAPPRILVDGKPAASRVADGFAALRVDRPCRVELSMPMALAYQPAYRPELLPRARSAWHGPLMLGSREAISRAGSETEWLPGPRGTYRQGGYELRPLFDSIYISKEELLRSETNILFT
jgi:hypothetical protein